MSRRSSARRRLGVGLLLAVALATLLPPVALLGITYLQALGAAEKEVRQLVAGGVRRTDRLLDRADTAMQRFFAEAGDTPAAEVHPRLARLVYNDPRFREAGIVDSTGNLVVTSFGPVEPPVPVPPTQRSDPALPRLQVIGLVRTAVMREQSVILAHPTPDGGELNLLVHPEVFTAYLQDAGLDADGFVAFTLPDGRLLASAGEPPFRVDRAGDAAPADWLEHEALAERGDVRVVAGLSRSRVLRDWYRNLWTVGGLTLVCNLLLAGVLWRVFRRSTGLDHDLRLGLANGEFTLVYQPIVDLATGRAVGVEALMRWRHPDDGPISPDVFIPLAEQTGLMGDVTGWVLRTAAVELSPILARRPGLWMSINVPLPLLESGEIVRLLRETLSGSGLEADRVRLEITERHLYEDGDGSIRAAMADLRRQGVGVGLDDFGTGSCGLSHLLDFDLSYLKIDKSYVRETGRDNRAAVVLDTLLDMGQRLRLAVIGEGIETVAQRTYLAAAGVRFGQGFLFSTPMPVTLLATYLAGQAEDAAPADQAARPRLGADDREDRPPAQEPNPA